MIPARTQNALRWTQNDQNPFRRPSTRWQFYPDIWQSHKLCEKIEKCVSCIFLAVFEWYLYFRDPGLWTFISQRWSLLQREIQETLFLVPKTPNYLLSLKSWNPCIPKSISINGNLALIRALYVSGGLAMRILQCLFVLPCWCCRVQELLTIVARQGSSQSTSCHRLPEAPRPRVILKMRPWSW